MIYLPMAFSALSFNAGQRTAPGRAETVNSDAPTSLPRSLSQTGRASEANNSADKRVSVSATRGKMTDDPWEFASRFGIDKNRFAPYIARQRQDGVLAQNVEDFIRDPEVALTRFFRRMGYNADTWKQDFVETVPIGDQFQTRFNFAGQTFAVTHLNRDLSIRQLMERVISYLFESPLYCIYFLPDDLERDISKMDRFFQLIDDLGCYRGFCNSELQILDVGSLYHIKYGEYSNITNLTLCAGSGESTDKAQENAYEIARISLSMFKVQKPYFRKLSKEFLSAYLNAPLAHIIAKYLNSDFLPLGGKTNDVVNRLRLAIKLDKPADLSVFQSSAPSAQARAKRSKSF